MNTKPSVSLPEEDYLAILDITRHLYQCETRADLRTCIKKHVLPFFQADDSSYGWMDVTLIKGRVIPGRAIDCIMIPEEQVHILEKISEYLISIPKAFARTTRQVIAHDVDIPREVLQVELQKFFNEHPEYQPSDIYRNKDYRATLTAIDRAENLVIGFHRYTPNDSVYTLREIRCLELFLPNLMHAIKRVAINEELKNYKALVEALTEVHTAIALVRADKRVLFRNACFEKILPIEIGRPLPPELETLIDRAADFYGPPFKPETTSPQIGFYETKEGPLQVSLTHLHRQGDEADQCWLMRLQPVVDPFLQLNRKYQKAELTPREMEVCVLINDGFDDADIARRLFISLQTVKNHLKSVYKKLDVHSRTQLVARLRPSPEEREA